MTEKERAKEIRSQLQQKIARLEGATTALRVFECTGLIPSEIGGELPYYRGFSQGRSILKVMDDKNKLEQEVLQLWT